MILFNRLFRRRKIDDSVREELDSHLAMRWKRNIELGISSD